MASTNIVGIEWGWLTGHRPRIAGCNARLGMHGDVVRIPIVRLTADDGSSGFGISRVQPDQASPVLGQSLEDLFSTEKGVSDPWLDLDYPIWDLAGHHFDLPVYALAAHVNGKHVPASLKVPCYDTSLYMDDLDLETDQAAAVRLADEARAGLAQGHTAFKMKIGRGARHMPLSAGTQRDITVIQAVRSAIGPNATLMLDANNGYNLNLLKQVLGDVRECNIYWIEEPFHEDAVLYQDLRTWQSQNSMHILIADGEGEASVNLLEWAHQGLIDVVQYDYLGYGFTRWLRTGRLLDSWGIKTGPHHYGTHYGNYASCHLGAAIQHFTFVEWDEATTPGLDGSAYRLEDGMVTVPDKPGYGLSLQEEVFRQAVQQTGGALWK